MATRLFKPTVLRPSPQPRDHVAAFFAADRMDRMSGKGREAKRGRPRKL